LRHDLVDIGYRNDEEVRLLVDNQRLGAFEPGRPVSAENDVLVSLGRATNPDTSILSSSAHKTGR